MSARIDTVVVGAGQAGLAASHYLSELGRDHVVLDRGRVAEAWRSHRWDSLRLLTPNWMTRLPGWSYCGPDPGGFMTSAELADFLGAYAARSAAPVEEHTDVLAVASTDWGYRVLTDRGAWTAKHVIVATGATGRPVVPDFGALIDPSVHQVHAHRYRNPDALPEGGVLVVGAASSGTQIAHELRTAGRDVVLAAGAHTRMPRRYRGMDVMWWMDRAGIFDTTIDEVHDPAAARRAPSFQLVGRPDGRSLDLGDLQRTGVTVAGRLVAAEGSTARFAPGLGAAVERADRRLGALLDRIDRYIDEAGLASEVLDDDRPTPLRLGDGPGEIDLASRSIRAVVWATGYRPHYAWLHVPVVDRTGAIVQRRGVTPVPGLYVLGQRFQHYRNSNFIDGVGRDARDVVDHLAGRVDSAARDLPGSPEAGPVRAAAA